MQNFLISLNDSMKMPTVGFGTWKVEDKEAADIVKVALESGYRLIDTAMIYNNEKGVGEGIKNSGLRREEIFLTTKVWNSDQGYDQTLRAFEKSLKNLNTDYIDLYLIHWPIPDLKKYVGTWKALVKLRSTGMVRSIGVSNFNEDLILELIENTGITPAVNQVELHPFFQQRALREFHFKHKIATEAYTPLARGNIFEHPIIQKLALKYQKTPAQIILRWHFENGIVAIPKSSHHTRMLENLDIFNFRLSADDLIEMGSMDSQSGRLGQDPLVAQF